jgi:hypothetical protein
MGIEATCSVKRPNTEQQSSGDRSAGNPLSNIVFDDLVRAGHAPAFRPAPKREAIREHKSLSTQMDLCSRIASPPAA